MFQLKYVDYLIAFVELMVLFALLLSTFFGTFGLSILNPVCAAAAVVELMAKSDLMYKDLFSKIPPGLDHPCRMFGIKFDFKPYIKLLPPATMEYVLDN